MSMEILKRACKILFKKALEWGTYGSVF
jgi:hypothetical protein